MFKSDMKQIYQLGQFFRKSPEYFKPAAANVLSSQAFSTRKNDIREIKSSMTIRDERFLNSSLRVKPARATKIDKQVAWAYSIKRPRFSGWEEQQTGKQTKKKRTPTTYSRGGSNRGKVRSKYRMKQGKNLYKPEKFNGKSYRSRFYFMMRVLGSRGGGEFLLSRDVPTKRGKLSRGYYELKGRKIKRVQALESSQPARNQWRSRSLARLDRKDYVKVWQRATKRAIKYYKPK